MPSIHILVAMTRERIIGNKGRIPWSIPKDMQLFRQLTVGKTVLMGRETYQSIGQPLPERHNIVISGRLPQTKGINVCNNFAAGIALAQTFKQDIFCIGGAKIYREALNIAQSLHISWVEEDVAGDCVFPEYDLNAWTETERRPFSGFVHCTYIRKNKKNPVIVVTGQ